MSSESNTGGKTEAMIAAIPGFRSPARSRKIEPLNSGGGGVQTNLWTTKSTFLPKSGRNYSYSFCEPTVKSEWRMPAHFSAIRQTPFDATSIDWFEPGLLFERTAVL